MQKHHVNPFVTFAASLAQIPVFLSLYFGLRDMSSIYPDFATGGMLWFENLSVPDPTYALPIINGALMLGLFQIAGSKPRQFANAEEAQKANLTKNMMRFVAVATVPITATLPSVSRP